MVFRLTLQCKNDSLMSFDERHDSKIKMFEVQLQNDFRVIFNNIQFISLFVDLIVVQMSGKQLKACFCRFFCKGFWASFNFENLVEMFACRFFDNYFSS